MDCRRTLNKGLEDCLGEDPQVLLLGEDIVDPYGGAFKVTQGLSTKWPDRVLSMPISEAAMVGIANGLALSGFKPVVEIMFGDFLTLAVDQLVNHAAKFNGMYAGKARAPLIVRTPMGGRRGYGPTHSQTLDSLLLGVPGLDIVSANEIVPLDGLLRELVRELDGPCLFLENKTLYGRENRPPVKGRLDAFAVRTGNRHDDCAILSLCGFDRADLTVAAHGGMLPLAMEAAMILAVEHEIFAEIAAPVRLQPFDPKEMAESVNRSRALLVAEEGQVAWGWGSEIVAHFAQKADNPTRFRRLGAQVGAIPAGKELEKAFLPQVSDIVEAARSLAGGGT